MATHPMPVTIPDGSVGSAPNNKWAPFFGEIEGYHEDVRADDRLAHEIYNLPEAYVGKSRHLEDILDFMIRKEDEFYTRELLPWKFMDDLHIKWTVHRFNRSLADVVPEQGISRLITQETERHTDNLVRRGLAFALEHGFMTTEEGRRNYSMNLMCIQDAVQTTCYFGVMHALFSGQNYYAEYRRKYDRHVRAARNLFRHERQMWGILQKDQKALYIMDAEIKWAMKRNGVTPNVLVLPPKAGIYVSMVPDIETVYSERGPGAHEALTKDRIGIPVFRGTRVFEAQGFDVDYANESVDLTSRSRMIGEYFVIPAPEKDANAEEQHLEILKDLVKSDLQDKGVNRDVRIDERIARALQQKRAEDGANAFQNPRQYINGKSPSIRIYSGDVDDWVEISYGEAAQHALNGSGDDVEILDSLKHLDDKLKDTYKRLHSAIEIHMGHLKSASDKRKLGEFVSKADGDYPFADDPDIDIIKAAVIRYHESVKGLKNSNDAVALLNAQDVSNIIKSVLEADMALHRKAYFYSFASDDYKHDILIFRPFQTYNMHSAIMARGGEELGFTAFGHADFQLADNVQNKTHFGNYTFYSKAIVRQPKYYTIIPDCFCSGYISGEGHKFFKPPTSDDPYSGDLERAIADGLLGSPECGHSLISWKIPAGSGKDLKPAIDLMGQFPIASRDYDTDERHYPGSDVLSRMQSIQELSQNRDDTAYLHQVQHINTVCFRGAQWTNGVFTHEGKGHWAGLSYPGCLNVKDGVMTHFERDRVPKKGDRWE